MSFTFVPKPSQMSGSARRMSNGLKKILKNGFSSMALRLPAAGHRSASILRPAEPGRSAGCCGPRNDTVGLGLEDGQLRSVEGQPLLRELADRPVGEQLLDRLVH